MMKIKPIGPTVPPIVFKSQVKDCQPLKPQAAQSLQKDEFTKEDIKEYSYEKEQEERQKRQEAERIKQEKEFQENIRRPGRYTKEVQNDNNGNNKNKGFQ